jgi:carbon-monoxide dehydrogenase medium subunit
VVVLDGNRFAAVSLALGPVAPKPFRASAAEAWLAGRPVAEETIEHAANLARQETRPRDSLLRCAAEYRRDMVFTLVKSTLQGAAKSALGRTEKVL